MWRLRNDGINRGLTLMNPVTLTRPVLIARTGVQGTKCSLVFGTCHRHELVGLWFPLLQIFPPTYYIIGTDYYTTYCSQRQHGMVVSTTSWGVQSYNTRQSPTSYTVLEDVRQEHQVNICVGFV